MGFLNSRFATVSLGQEFGPYHAAILVVVLVSRAMRSAFFAPVANYIPVGPEHNINRRDARPFSCANTKSGHSKSLIMRISYYDRIAQSCRLELAMPMPVSLDKAPQNFLDQTKWAQLQAFASNDLIALTFLNATFPDPDDPSDFFFPRSGSFEEAVGCYHLGRDLQNQCRRQLTERKLLATGVRSNGRREIIKPEQWHNIWPMFATNRATGPNDLFDDVKIIKAKPLETRSEQLLNECVDWLRVHDEVARTQKKDALLYLARSDIAANLTHSVFNAAYKICFGYGRGRPRKQPKIF